jgi:hypothetical protein
MNNASPAKDPRQQRRAVLRTACCWRGRGDGVRRLPVDGDPTVNAELSRTLRKIALVSAGSFVFAFSLVPLYNAACEKSVRLQARAGAAGQQQLAGVKPDDARTVRIQFDGTVNSKLAWDFKPVHSSMDVHPGRQYEALFWRATAPRKPSSAMPRPRSRPTRPRATSPRPNASASPSRPSLPAKSA